MKYRIIGADGKTYGPVDLEQIRQWLKEGRAESRTPVYVEGATNWTTLGLLPELAPQLASAPPAVSAPKPGVAMAPGTNGFATAGLVCGLLSWICCCCFPISLLGVIFSVIALIQINSQAEPQEGRMMAIIGLVLSAVSLLFSIVAVLLQFLVNQDNMHWQFMTN